MIKKFSALLVALCLLVAGCGSPESSLKKARELAAAGRHAEAVDIYQKVISRQKGEAWLSSAWLDMARSQKELGSHPQAKASAGSALETAQNDPDRLAAVLFLADLQVQDKEFDPAEATLKRLAASAEKDPRRLALMAAIAQGKGGSPMVQASEFLNLDATRMVVGKVTRTNALDAKVFPYVQHFVEKGKDTKIVSPDGKRFLWRGLAADGYFLYVSDIDGKNQVKLRDCKNAYQPAWAPDSKRILFSSINWLTRRRSIMIYDLQSKAKQKGFDSKKGMGAMASFSTDGSKIAFIYLGDLWLRNSNGIGLTKVNLKDVVKQKVKEAVLLAWSRDGSQLAYQPMGYKDIFIVTFVRKAS
jgi:tetratricopeptide (TPR) repeat protein